MLHWHWGNRRTAPVLGKKPWGVIRSMTKLIRHTKTSFYLNSGIDSGIFNCNTTHLIIYIWSLLPNSAVSSGNHTVEYRRLFDGMIRIRLLMMTSSNGNFFRVTGTLFGGIFTGHRWIPLTKASDAELWCFLWSVLWMVSKLSWSWWFETPSHSVLRHFNVYQIIQALLQKKSPRC